MNEYSSQFGQIVVGLGFISDKHLKEALNEQIEDKLANRPHRLIGRMLFEDGWIGNEHINIVHYIMQNYTAPL